jgi:hypothetical protein
MYISTFGITGRNATSGVPAAASASGVVAVRERAKALGFEALLNQGQNRQLPSCQRRGGRRPGWWEQRAGKRLESLRSLKTRIRGTLPNGHHPARDALAGAPGRVSARFAGFSLRPLRALREI